MKNNLWRHWAEVVKPLNFSTPNPWPADWETASQGKKMAEVQKEWKARRDEIMTTFPKTSDERFAILRENYGSLMEKVVEPEFKRRGEPEEFRGAVELLRELEATQYELGEAYF